MIIAQQSTAVALGTLGSAAVTIVAVTVTDTFRAGIPVVVNLDSADSTLPANVGLAGCRYATAGSNAGKLELYVVNPTAAPITGGTHTFNFKQVE